MGSKSKSKTRVDLNPLIEEQSEYTLGEARGLYDRTDPLPSTYVGISDPRRQALDQMLSMAQGGTAVPQNVLNEYNKTMSGGYLDTGSNPYLQDIVQRSVGAAMSAPGSSAMQQGRFGSGVMANAMADAGQETASRLYGAQYEAERARMNQALQLAPQMNELQYADQMQQGFVGQQLEADQAAQQSEDVRQHLWPMEKLAAFQSLVAGNPLMAETTTTATTKQGFDWGSAIGGIAGGAMAMCHVAAEFFGWFSPDWIAAREWIVNGWEGDEADAFREVYSTHGKEMARRVREDDGYAATLRPFFEWARDSGKEQAGGA